MTGTEILIAAEAVVLALLSLLVVGLLRSHAEILRRLAGGSGRSEGPEASIRREGAGTVGRAAPVVSGQTLDGDAVQLRMGPAPKDTLLAFLSSGCMTCLEFWHALPSQGSAAFGPDEGQIMIVTKDPSLESPGKLQELAPGGSLPVVMSSAAWEDYEVPGAPYFVYVSGAHGDVVGEGVAQSWEQLLSLVGNARADGAMAVPSGELGVPGNGSGSGAGRITRIDEELRAAGIDADHPSLYETLEPLPAEPEQEEAR